MTMSQSGEYSFEQLEQLHNIIVAKRKLKYLAKFNRDIKMELLFLILLNEHDEEWGIAQYITTLRTSPQSDSSMRDFIAQLIEDQAVLVVGTSKQSRKHLILSDQLREEVQAYCSAIGEIFAYDNMELAA
jgi:hypothetical protein